MREWIWGRDVMLDVISVGAVYVLLFDYGNCFCHKSCIVKRFTLFVILKLKIFFFFTVAFNALPLYLGTIVLSFAFMKNRASPQVKFI